ncbi:bifunctional phosphoribosyl-AMP cyclohydrolase/phosphoribosyl-ATP diphosphatase HisIE [Buchnera aphidicola]|uniref:Histidine biosynthesis bifunctional protein HisIE n=1 Tax=Buchnera aphidicola str. USDA (Myzus persicae) TaxID=1009856 RepID=W0P5E3_BUCMP|nr:bifunctional phosphoribosyl-AMP cyclohydrolase/phosphoribosyl-ATP diphosphatase HisIE [Buchnera aphidicola]AHG60263.1 Hisi [Buchnera aphidicola str. USDA (Myzus persicae)]AHG60841.1 Hisi [Buchnera aphidicola str. W106 (Myzus persicae)]AHG61413.1 Hisi [Buchnera aphidicola str. G002 (Myzus persicae)]AHG61986.1 Hisi [Buchnera aphidicola str. F009 (Myzus persicae)]WAI03050.1 MAG: bifunctional phosphoribosyl-AMP cyclohydrolase/phosphoribosyl-ATP diphosphatase HisIE [Buchnera aphidicola (Myzus pe
MLTSQDLLNLNWLKTDGMIPVIIQNFFSNKILMHGYMNKEALLKTQKNGLVTFYSRTKKRLWTKGEESGNYLKVIEITTDCDYDTLLILVEPLGKTCHLGNSSCFLLKKSNMTFLVELENIIKKRKKIYKNNSYTSELYKSGTSRIAQKVGEEAIETILAVMKKEKLEIINESSDLLYHFIVLLHDQNLNLNIILDNLQKRNIKKLSTDSQLI